MKRIVELALKLFNAVPSGYTEEIDIKQGLAYGIIIDEKASYASKEILNYFKKNKLSGKQFNATFHKSWNMIKKSSREELFIHQILHYFTTYGTNFTSNFIYIPAEKLNIPKVKDLPIKIIRGIEKEELIEKALSMLTNGLALEEKTIDDVLELLELLGHKFETVDNIKNKEALIKIISQSGVYPSHPVEFLRFLVYLSTESTLLIKNSNTIDAIKEKKLNIVEELNSFGLEKCATIFNRFKPIWLAFKSNRVNIPYINKISKLSKILHQPMPIDVLNTITSIEHQTEAIQTALGRVNNFRKIRLLNALRTRMNAADSFLYRIRNGKSFSKQGSASKKLNYFKEVYKIIYEDLVANINVEGKTIKYPENIDYAIPTSEKMFIGNIPIGTKISAKKLVSGIYWENEWGANDLDLSALSLEGKIGWNSAYKGNGLLYSGDMTDAKKGATELLYTNGKLDAPALSILNIYSGKVGCKFKIIIGNASKVSENYMFNPNELILELETEMKSRQQIVGIFIPHRGQLNFVVVNTGFGNISVSGHSEHSDTARNALFYQYHNPISFKELLSDAGAIVASYGYDFDIDLMPQNLQKDSLIALLND